MRTLFLDVDGVLVDWLAGCHRLHGKRWSPGDATLQYWPYTFGPKGWDFYKDPAFDVELKDLFTGMNRNFWASLGWMPDGPEILSKCERYFAGNVFLLSSPCHEDGTIDGRFDWINANMPKYRKRILVGDCKEAIAKAAGPDAVLLDDWDRNTNAWTEAGGTAIVCPRPWNSAYKKADDIMNVLDISLRNAST